MKVILRFFALFLLCFSVSESAGQDKVLTAGIQVKPIVPTSLFNTGTVTRFEGSHEYTLNPKLAYSFGMVVRKGITKLFSFETGINYVRRNYDVSLSDPERGVNATHNFRIVGYEIPTLGLVYVKLGDQFYMNGAFGLSLDMFPSNVQTGDTSFSALSYRSSWLQTALLANFGWEYRTKESGYLYMGFSYHRPFTHMYTTRLTYETPTASERIDERLSGNYLTIDLRYFFHEKPQQKKKKTPKEPSTKDKLKEFERMQRERDGKKK